MPVDWQPGDGCVFTMPDTDNAVRIYGVVEAVVDDAADVIELHASHALWGGSGGNKVGEIHTVPVANLRPHTLQPFEERRWDDIRRVE